ncbi:MAG: hypothetical protein N2745_01030, partial [Syntrophorhabdaceae bacterium]|nr:hypothetical protein [Syntrophorhabdaceae bacterium]
SKGYVAMRLEGMLLIAPGREREGEAQRAFARGGGDASPRNSKPVTPEKIVKALKARGMWP